MSMPSEPLQDGPRHHWTNPVSRDQTLSRLEDFRESGWLNPVWKENTTVCVRVAERYWKKYCNHIEANYVELLLRCEPAAFQNWIDWMIRTSKPKTRETYAQYWKWLSEYYQFWAKRKMDNSTLKQINRYVNGRMLIDHQVSLRARRKDTLSAEDLGILLRCHWVYDTSVYTHERQRVQMGLIMLFSAFTGTRPGVLLPHNKTTRTRLLDGNGSGADLSRPDQISNDPSSDRSKNVGSNSNPLKSDLPAHTQVNRRPRTVCYKDIELYLLRNPDGTQRDIFVAEIEFVNLKGSKEGEDGTVFMMHEDAQLAYCPIAHILALAFTDDAFESPLLTPEYICRLKVPKRLSSLPLRWKKSKLDMPLFRHTIQTEYGVRTHPTLPMKYDTSNSSLRQLGETAGYQYPIKSYCFRRWTANEANRAFTDQERNRILGHSGTRVFEKHYHDKAIHRDIQSVVLLRPPQEALCRAAAQMNRNRDPLAPSSLTEKQLQTLCRMPRLIQLRKDKDALRRKMAGSVQDEQARGTDLSKRHAAVGRELARVRAAYRREARTKVKEDYHNTMPTIEIEKQISQLKQGFDLNGSDEEGGDDEEWKPPIPSYVFDERARVADAFWGSEAETLTGSVALARRIQAVKDLAVLCERREPSRRGGPLNWNQSGSGNGDDDDNTSESDERATDPHLDPNLLHCPHDQCIFCFGDSSLRPARLRKYTRIDSVRRHLEKTHLNLISRAENVHCPHPACKGRESFDTVEVFLNHAARVHDYDLHMLPRRHLRSRLRLCRN